LVASLILLAVSSPASLADDFRIQTNVYASGAKKPVSEYTTIFRDGRVYDFCENPREVVIFDAAAGRFVLVNPGEKRRAEITLDQLDTILAALRRKLAAGEHPYSAFLAEPKFRQESGGKPNDVAFLAPWVNYHIRFAPAATDAVAEQYSTFSTNCTRLNALRRPALLPRLNVNAWLNERKLIPQTVRLTAFKSETVAGGSPTVEAEFRSEHVLARGLRDEDLRRVSQAEIWQAECHSVSLASYWGAAESGK
jgi:hypothetical protein